MFASTSVLSSTRFALFAAVAAMTLLFSSHAFAAKQKVTVNAVSTSTTTSVITGGSSNTSGIVQGCASFFCNQKAKSTNSASTGIVSGIISGSANIITIIQSQ